MTTVLDKRNDADLFGVSRRDQTNEYTIRDASINELMAQTRKILAEKPELLKLLRKKGITRIAPSSKSTGKDGCPVVLTGPQTSRRISAAVCPSVDLPEVEAFCSASRSLSMDGSDCSHPDLVTSEDLWVVWASFSKSLVAAPEYIVSYMPKDHLSPGMVKRYEANSKYAIKLNYGDRSCIGMMPFGGHSSDPQVIEMDKFARMLHHEWMSQGRPANDVNGASTNFYDERK